MAWMLAGVMGFFWNLFNLKGEPPVTRQMLRLIGKPFTVNISKARRELGYAPRVSWKQGVAEMQSSVEVTTLGDCQTYSALLQKCTYFAHRCAFVPISRPALTNVPAPGR